MTTPKDDFRTRYFRDTVSSEYAVQREQAARKTGIFWGAIVGSVIAIGSLFLGLV